jgi:hypothetical protein
MLISVKELHGSTLHALDGEIGRLDEILFDDEHWTVRYLIVHTGSWFFGQKVLISPLAFGHADWERRMLNVNLTREQIKNSPSVDTDKPVSRQWESDYYNYYAWPYYWGGMSEMGGMGYMGGVGGWGTYWYPGTLLAHPFGNSKALNQEADEQVSSHTDAHLRSTKEVTGYGIAATDGHIGHIEDFIVDDDTWKLRYFAVDTRDWWPGKKVLLPPDWIGEVNWADRNVTVDVTRDQVRNAPAWDPAQPIDHAFEDEVYSYYVRQRPSDRERLKELA